MRKKLQQLHNEAAQKRFTIFIALLVVLLFVIGGSLQVQAQDNNTNGTPIAGIESLTGCSEKQVRDAVSSGNTFPDNPNQIFFLYNVQTGLLLNAGGYWGTHVSLKEYGMPLWIHIDEDKDKDDQKGWIHLAQEFDSKESKKRATTWNTRLGIGLLNLKTMVCILTEHIFIKDSYRKISSREVGNWRLFLARPTPTGYTRTATPH